MGFRIFLAAWSVAFLALFGWLATHRSPEPIVLGRYSFAYFTLLAVVAALTAVSLLTQRPSLYRRLYKIRREIILTLCSLLFSLITVEAAIRVFDPLGISYFEETSRYHLDKLPDPVLVYRHAPGLRTYQGVSVSINELGFRDRNLEKKLDGELRILLLGDSVTFGWGVPVEATFGRRLETILASALGRPVRTVNTGVGSYNTVQEYALLRTYVDVIQPDVVVLIYVTNDIEINDPPFDPASELSLRGKSPREAVTILLGNSWLYRLGYFVFRLSSSRRPSALDKNSRGMRESMEALSTIATFCRERGVRFVTFFYPLRRISSGGATSALFSEVQTVGRNHGFPVVDIGPWWTGVDMRSVTNSRIDPHANERGHEIIAAGMADFLLTQGLVETKTAASR